MSDVLLRTAIHAPLDTVWETISDFNGLPNYMEAVVESKMEGAGVGAVRTFSLRDGAVIVERLESFDAQNRVLSYSILESPLPFENYVSTMELTAMGERECELTWSSVFDPKEGFSEEEAREVIKGVYRMGFEGLKKRHEG